MRKVGVCKTFLKVLSYLYANNMVMKKLTVKKKALISTSFLAILGMLLIIHIYVVSRPKAPTADTRIMARIDFTGTLDSSHGNAITEWLYKQKGVDHVLYNASSKILVYTFCPVDNNALAIYTGIQHSFSAYQPVRVLPSQEEIEGGCPITSGKTAASVFNFFKRL